MCNRPTAGHSTLISEMDYSRRFGCSGRMSAVIPTMTKLMSRPTVVACRATGRTALQLDKHNRPVATRCDKLAANGLGFI
jgi:hypothetical protein